MRQTQYPTSSKLPARRNAGRMVNTAADPVMFLPADPDKALQAAIEHIEVLQDVYQRETEMLKAADPNGFLALQDEKLSCAGTYERSVREIMARRDEFKGADQSLKAKLRRMQGDFSELMKSNAKALSRMQRVTDRLSGRLREAVKEATLKQRAYSYGENGSMRENPRRSISTGVSETA